LYDVLDRSNMSNSSNAQNVALLDNHPGSVGGGTDLSSYLTNDTTSYVPKDKKRDRTPLSDGAKVSRRKVKADPAQGAGYHDDRHGAV
jgi:hypothetical protein